MKHCMIVDRSSVVRKVTARILSDSSVSVSEAESMEEALGKCASMMPDLIIVDSGLPNNQTTELIRAIRAIDDADQPKIMVLMTEMNLVTMTKTKRVGADDFLLKPFNRDQLLESLGSKTPQAA